MPQLSESKFLASEPRRASRRTPAVLFAGILIAAAAAGCSTSTPSEPENKNGKLPEVSIEAFGNVHAKFNPETGTVSLPLDEYAVNDDYDFANLFVHAKAVAADTCMRKKGFRNPYVTEIEWDAVTPGENRLYGIWDISSAKKYGYEVAPDRGLPKLNTLALGVEGNKVFESCYQENIPRFKEITDFVSEPTIAETIRANAYGLAQESENGRNAIQARKKCLEENGVVTTGDGRVSEQYQGQGKEARIRLATVEANCANETKAVQTLFDIHAQYEAAFIKQNEAQLSELKRKKQKFAADLEKEIQG